MAKPVICQNCHTEMEPGKKTRSRVMEWTEYTCPNCGSVWSEGEPLPGHEPKPVMPKVRVEVKTVEDTLDEPVIGEDEEAVTESDEEVAEVEDDA